MHDDLTHNDVVIRQINASTTLKRLLDARLKQPPAQNTLDLAFCFPGDFYGEARYWLRANPPMKLTMLAFMLIYVTQVLILRGLLCFLTPFNKFNVVIQLKKKLRAFA